MGWNSSSTGGTGELVEAWREEFNEPEIIDSNTILDNSSDPEPVRIHSGETRPNFIPSLEILDCSSFCQNYAFCRCQGLQRSG